MKSKRILRSTFLPVLMLMTITLSAQRNAPFKKSDILSAMKEASDYMVKEVSCNGGYVWYYSTDLTECWGEVPARKSQIWVQGPGTPAMGHLFLEMYAFTGDEDYLNYAKKVADALIYGQHPQGGWHYFIDFDKPGLAAWYADTASQFVVGWEEFRHYYGNCTYDDNVTQGATKYLMDLYEVTMDPEYLGPLKKALNFMLVSQYPNGAWPQWYPLRYEYAHDGLPDYTSYYTLNDFAMNNTIDVLLEAYELLGNKEYLEAARRGADFFMIAQGPEGHAAWPDQLDMNLQPVAARTHEPASWMEYATTPTIHQLEKMFLYTGDRRYLRPIPGALNWLESVIVDIDENGDPVYHQWWYDPETNYPIIMETLPELTDEGYFEYRFTLDSTVNFVDYPGKLPERERYERIRDVEAGKAQELYEELYGEKHQLPKVNKEEIRQLVRSINENGIWIETITVHDVDKTMVPDYQALIEKGPYLYGVKKIQGISTQTYMDNMRKFMGYLEEI